MHYQKTHGSCDPGAPEAGLIIHGPPEPPTGVMPRAKSRPGVGANDGQADDFITLAQDWESESAEPLLVQGVSASPQLTLDAIAGQFSAGQMRQLGATLLKLADALDDDWNPDELRATYHWLTQAGRIERRALQLAQVAIRMRTAARRRTRHLSGEWFGEPGWEMLLELFIQFSGGARVSTKSLVIASGAPDTTALRVIDRLEEAGLVERATSQMDKRVTLISLTRHGVVSVGLVLMESEA
jgi:hypothetical protein